MNNAFEFSNVYAQLHIYINHPWKEDDFPMSNKEEFSANNCLWTDDAQRTLWLLKKKNHNIKLCSMD